MKHLDILMANSRVVGVHMRYCIMILFFCIGIPQYPCKSQETNIKDNGTMTQAKSIVIPDVNIVLEVCIPKNIMSSKPILVEVKVKNDGNKPVMIYMPGISIFPRLIYDTEKALMNPGKPDEFFLPCLYCRSKSDNEDLNYVMLEPGDFYGRKYQIAPVSINTGEMSFTLTYNTDKANNKLKLKGKFSVESEHSKIYSQKE